MFTIFNIQYVHVVVLWFCRLVGCYQNFRGSYCRLQHRVIVLKHHSMNFYNNENLKPHIYVCVTLHS